MESFETSERHYFHRRYTKSLAIRLRMDAKWKSQGLR